MRGQTTTSDAFLFYDVGDWGQYGLAVPNWSDNTHSLNGTIRYLTEVMGRNLQAIMWHSDSRLRTPPSINTLIRVHKLITRGRDILSSRAVPSHVPFMESQHALPSPEVFNVYPVPYFKVRNAFMKEWCGYILLALTDCFQSSENARPLDISTDFASQISKYLQRVYVRMSVELLKVPQAIAEAPDFTLTETNFASYNPSLYYTSTELIDDVSDVLTYPTEDMLEPLTNGIPVTLIPQLGPYPVGGFNAVKNEKQTTNTSSFFQTQVV